MIDTRKLLSCLFVLALVAGLGSVALADAPDAPEAPAAPQIDGTEAPAPPAAEPETPAADHGAATEDDPFLDLETPEPELKCLTGDCSNDFQCHKWVGPNSFCYKEPGQGCGFCTMEP